MSLYALRDATPACGGKALGLARLIAAGLPVPEGFVIDDSAFREIAGAIDPSDDSAIGHQLAAAAERIASAELPAELARDVEDRAVALDMLAVRSSATIEDGVGGSGAGVFSSYTRVAPADVWSAIRAVWTSALTPLAVAYGRRRGGAIAIGVIVQRFVPSERVTIYTRAPGKPGGDSAMIQRRSELERMPRSSSDPSLVLALRAEAAIGATGGADVELAGEWIVQARPIIHPVAEVRPPAPPSVIAPLVADGRPWRWDISHNPDPLSVAQAALVERIDRAELAPYAMRVCAGYLYTTPRGASSAVARPATRDELLLRVRDIEARLAEALGAEVPPLAEALARYLTFYRIWATELGPLIAAARAGLTSAHLAGARPSAVEATLLAAARGELDETAAIARLGILAPAWDVAVATYGERPGLLQRAIAAARSYEPPPRGTDEAASIVRTAADLAERDDEWFARAQLLIRRSILARADALHIAPDDAFWIPVEDLLRDELDPADVRRRASGARNAAARSAKWAMPLTVGGSPSAQHSRALRGVGTGSRVTGRIVRLATLASTITPGHGDIVVTRAVTPALAVLVVGCAALVSETGGLLDHGAALARELGIPCVVGCTDAWSLLSDGMVVTVDGDRGSVELSDQPTDEDQSSSS